MRAYFGFTKKTEEDYLREYPYEIELLRQGMPINKVTEKCEASRPTIVKLKTMFAKDCGCKCKQPKGNKTKGQKVAQYGKDGNLIKVWDSSYIAAKTLGFLECSGFIKKCCNGQFPLYHGYQWRLVNKRVAKKIEPYIPKRQAVRVAMYDLSMKHIATFESVRVAAKCINGTSTCIFDCINGLQKTHKNHIWKRV